MADRSITRISIRWDTADPDNQGWYVEAFDGPTGFDLVDDSQKSWFPVDVDSYGRDDEDALRDALQAAFPRAEIQ